MSIKEAALSLSHFNKVIADLPETRLKDNLKAHIKEITYSLLCERVKRNQRRHFHSTSPCMGSTLKRKTRSPQHSE